MPGEYQRSLEWQPGFFVPAGANFTASIQNSAAHDNPGIDSHKQQIIKYKYNERGWLSAINDPANVTADKAFGMKLYYDSGTIP